MGSGWGVSELVKKRDIFVMEVDENANERDDDNNRRFGAISGNRARFVCSRRTNYWRSLLSIERRILDFRKPSEKNYIVSPKFVP